MMAPSEVDSSHASSPETQSPKNRNITERQSQFTAYSQALFDTSYRAHLMQCMVDCTRQFGRYYDASIFRDLVQVLSDLAHMSNKFIVQLMDCDCLECLSSVGLFSYSRIDADDFQLDNEDGKCH